MLCKQATSLLSAGSPDDHPITLLLAIKKAGSMTFEQLLSMPGAEAVPKAPFAL